MFKIFSHDPQDTETAWQIRQLKKEEKRAKQRAESERLSRQQRMVRRAMNTTPQPKRTGGFN